MSVSHAPAGYTGTVDEIQEARRFSLVGPPFRVASVSDWTPSADASINRQVDITAGQGMAYGVADVTAAADSVTFAANTGGANRYDALVATFCWAANAGLGLSAHTVTFRVIQGTTSPPTVNASSTTVDNTKINRARGVQYDALIAVVRVRPSVGIFSSGDVVDCRMWGGYEGYADCGSAQYLTMLDTFPGALVHDVSTNIVWSRNLGGVWGFEKWIGTDKTKQPMMSLRHLTRSIASSTVGTNVAAWPDVTDHSGGLFSYVSSQYIQCNVYGRVRVNGYCYSTYTQPGWVALAVPNLTGGGDYIPALDNRQTRAGSSAFAGGGDLRQMVGSTFQAAPGDLLSLTLAHQESDNAAVPFDVYLTAVYV